MGGSITDIFDIPVKILVVGVFIVAFLYMAAFGMTYNSNTALRTNCVRFADAMNTFVSNNGGFADVGAGSFTEFVEDYLNQKPLKGGATVLIAVYDVNDRDLAATTAVSFNKSAASSANTNNTRVSVFNVSDSGSAINENWKNVLYGSAAVDNNILRVLNDNTTDALLATINRGRNYTRLYGSNAAATSLTESDVILQEGQIYQIAVVPNYRDVDSARPVVITGRITSFTKGSS